MWLILLSSVFLYAWLANPRIKNTPTDIVSLKVSLRWRSGAFVITTAITIFWNAINNVYALFSGEDGSGGAAPIALIVALITVIVKLGLTAYTNRIGQQTQSTAVIALAQDHRNDIFSALAATIGIALGRLGLLWVDPLAGALVALIVLRTGIQIIQNSASDLLMTQPDPDLTQHIGELLDAVPGVMCVEELMVYQFGPYLMLNLTICVDGTLTVIEGDAISSRAEKHLFDSLPYLRRVHIHYHPRTAPQRASNAQQQTPSLPEAPVIVPN